MEKEKRLWKVSKKCPDCNRKLYTDNKRILCLNCSREWSSISLLKEED